jgi:nucleotide-binding universal stress UspA family protein
MYKKILVPIDGSPFAECVLSHVKSIATGCNVSEVVLLYVVEPMVGVNYDIPGEWFAETQKKAIDFASNYLKEISEDLRKSGIVVNNAVLQGPAADTILTYAQSNDINLIVISTHGRSGVTRWVFGSVADKVVHQSTIPVLIVSPPACRPAISK